jgi:nitrogen fixation protein FixH
MKRQNVMVRTAYRWFPHSLLASMALVFAVNGYFIYAAIDTFPGAAGTDGFDLSNGYDKVMATAAKQAALGWKVESAIDEAHHPVLSLTDKAGAPLSGITIDAHAERPLGPPETTALNFRPLVPATYLADATLAPGQWDILMTVTSGQSRYTATRRLVVK